MNERKVEGIDETVYEAVLDNGLKIYMWVREDVNTFYATYSVNYGSLHTDFKIGNKEYHTPAGIAHYIEHLKFNLGPDETAHQMFYEMGSDTNAFTTFNYTNYQVLANKEPYKNVNKLLDFVQKKYFTKQLVNKERGIIASEAGIGDDNPYSLILFGMLEGLYKRPEYSRIITGEVEDIKKISLEDIELIFDAFYHPQNCFLVVTGNFNPYQMLASIKENQSKKEFIKYLNPIRIKKLEPKKVINKYKEKESNVNNYKIKIGIKVPIKKLSLMDASIYAKIIMKANFGSTSDLKNELIDKELICNDYYSVSNFDEYLTLSYTFDTSYKDEVLKKVYDKFDNMELFESTFKRIINSNIATTILDYEDVENVNLTLQSEVIQYGEVTYNKKEILENIKYEDVLEYMNTIDFTNRTTMVAKPFEK